MIKFARSRRSGIHQLLGRPQFNARAFCRPRRLKPQPVQQRTFASQRSAKRRNTAITRRMIRTHNWIATSGGPHLLIADEQLSHWQGIERWRDHRDPADLSDYARACRVSTWLGSIACHQGRAVVFSGDAGNMAWYSNGQGDGGSLVQWLGVDDERLIEPALHTPQLRDLLESSDAERLEFETGASGAMWLMDASDRGCDLRDNHQVLALRPGSYLARAACYRSDGLSIVVREICRISSPPNEASYFPAQNS
jgi:Immunity protein 21